MSEAHAIRLQLARPAFTLDVDLALPATGITAVFGPSGCGKTTLLRCVAGLERAAAGRIAIAGETWQDSARGVFVPTWQRPLGYVFQEASLFDHLDVAGNIAFGLPREHRGGSQALDALVDLLGIRPLLKRRTHELSGGQRQRVAIARALAPGPRLLLLDEPLAALDQARRREVLPWLERLRTDWGVPMLYVTHAADEVTRLADTLVLLDHGRVAASGLLAATLARLDLPPLLGDDAGALLQGRVQALDARWKLAQVTFDGGALWIADRGLAVNDEVRVQVLARDVSIALQKPEATSIQNLLDCEVRGIAPGAHPSQALVQMACGESLLLSRITARAVDALRLTPGQRVWAQVKSAALVR